MLRSVLGLAFAVLFTAQAAAADKVVLMLNWFVYGEHAPFYYGKDKGIYAAQGIDLEIQEGRGSGFTTQAVGAKSATFGYVDIPTMMRAAVKGAPVIATGVLLQTSPMSVISLAEKNIRKPEDIKGKIVALTPGGSNEQIWPLFMKKTGLKESDVTTVAGDAKVNAVINNQADVVLGYPMNEALVVKDATGKPVYSIKYADYGINLVSSGLITHKSLIEQNPDLVRRFMLASTLSVEAAIKDPDATADAILKVLPKAGKRATLIEGFQLSVPLFKPSEGAAGRPFRVGDQLMTDTVATMVEYSGLDPIAKKDPKALYTNDYLPN